MDCWVVFDVIVDVIVVFDVIIETTLRVSFVEAVVMVGSVLGENIERLILRVEVWFGYGVDGKTFGN